MMPISTHNHNHSIAEPWPLSDKLGPQLSITDKQPTDGSGTRVHPPFHVASKYFDPDRSFVSRVADAIPHSNVSYTSHSFVPPPPVQNDTPSASRQVQTPHSHQHPENPQTQERTIVVSFYLFWPSVSHV